jgi:hypothetical protein
MKEYFILQFKMLNRQLTEWGIEPVVGYLVGIFAFIGISVQLFEKTQFAEYIYIVLALSLVIKLNVIDRNDFLKLCYSNTQFIGIRIVENLIISIAFVAFLVFQEKYWSSILLFILAFLFSLIDLKNKSSFTLPTPFYKHPFEFTVGFRSNYFIYFFAYFLTFMSIRVGNFNLGIFSLILISLSCINYFINSEDEFYVWIFSLTPKEFIRYKFLNIVQYSTILSLPIIISLALFFYTKIDIILGIQFLGFLFIFTTMLAKYSVFPEKLNIRFAIVIALTVSLPPLLLLIIPYLYLQSTRKLKEILE